MKKSDKIQMWDEDRGWITWCDNCKKKVKETDEVCIHCGSKLKKEVIRT
jgi:rRNA maturation endonuclease Nob1